MNRLFAWLFPFDHVFKAEVERCGGSHAQDIVARHLINHQPLLSTQEEITALARQKAEQFYQSGSLWLLLKAHHIGTHQQVTETYISTFIQTYKSAHP